MPQWQKQYINPETDQQLEAHQMFNDLQAIKQGNSILKQNKNSHPNLHQSTLNSDMKHFSAETSSSNHIHNHNKSLSAINAYLVPEEVYTKPNWGKETAAQLDKYMQNYNSYPGTTKTGLIAPFYDMWRNYKTMRDDQKWVGGDNFFHCKANYEAAKRGLWGNIVGKTLSLGREMYGIAKGEPLSDVRKDWHANRKGWNGAKTGLSLQEACPTNPKAYVDLKDYEDIF